MQSTMTSRNERLIPSYDYTVQDAIEEYELAQNGRACPNNNMPSKWAVSYTHLTLPTIYSV